MKDEELADKYAEEYFGKKTELVEVWKLKSCKDNFLAGLKSGRPQWHTPDGMLPDEEGDYLFYLRDGEETMYEVLSVGIDGNGYCYIESHLWSITDVIAWCEIPTFETE